MDIDGQVDLLLNGKNGDRSKKHKHKQFWLMLGLSIVTFILGTMLVLPIFDDRRGIDILLGIGKDDKEPVEPVGADAWLGISSAEYDSHCGDDGSHTIEEALDGTDYWGHYAVQGGIHWFVLDLSQTYTISKVRGRSKSAYDPTDINIYIDNSNPPTTLCEEGITTWQDTNNWVEIVLTTEGTGRYIKVEIENTEGYIDNTIRFGDDSPTPSIFDAYGDVAAAPSRTWTELFSGYITGGNVTDYTELFSGWISGGNVTDYVELFSGYITGGNATIEWREILSGYITGGNITGYTELFSGYITGGNISTYQELFSGWITGGNATVNWIELLSGWISGGNVTISWDEFLSGYITGGNVTSYSELFSGYITGGNITDYIELFSGWITGGNTSVRSWQELFSGYITGGNITSYSELFSGWISGGNVTDYVELFSGWISGGNTTPPIYNITITDEYPTNGSVNVSINTSLHFTVASVFGYTMNISVYTGSNLTNCSALLGSFNLVGNGTYYLGYHNASNVSTEYAWRVNVSDGHGNYRQETYNFTTASTTGVRAYTPSGYGMGMVVTFAMMIGLVFFIIGMMWRGKRKNDYYRRY